jgi:flagellar biosynthesis chaperone FliJ
MARDPLLVLLKLRLQVVDHARRQVAACVEGEQRIVAHLQSIEEARRLDEAARETMTDAWRYEDMFAASRKRHAERRQVLANELRAATSRSEAARHGLSMARMAAEAVERLVEVRRSEAQEEARRRQQHALDDVARALWLRQRRAKMARSRSS